MAKPVEVYRDRAIYRTADMSLVPVLVRFQFCVENLRESDQGPTLHTETSIEACREFIDDEADDLAA